MKKIKLGDVEVCDYEKSPILLAACKDKCIVWTHLHRDIDCISPRSFDTADEARKYAMSLAELLNQFVIDAEKLIQNYNVGKTIETSRITIIDI